MERNLVLFFLFQHLDAKLLPLVIVSLRVVFSAWSFLATYGVFTLQEAVHHADMTCHVVIMLRLSQGDLPQHPLELVNIPRLVNAVPDGGSMPGYRWRARRLVVPALQEVS